MCVRARNHRVAEECVFGNYWYILNSFSTLGEGYLTVRRARPVCVVGLVTVRQFYLLACVIKCESDIKSRRTINRVTS